MIGRRFFLRGIALSAAVAAFGDRVGSINAPMMADNVVGQPFDPRSEGFYVACGYLENGQLYLSELVNNRSKVRKEVAADDIAGISSFVRESGLRYALFINWHARVGENIKVQEVETHVDGVGTVAQDSLEDAMRASLRWLVVPSTVVPAVEVAPEAEVGAPDAMPSVLSNSLNLPFLPPRDLSQEARIVGDDASPDAGDSQLVDGAPAAPDDPIYKEPATAFTPRLGRKPP